jgi:hypothetical protein
MARKSSGHVLPELISKLAVMGPATLEAVRKFVLELEIRALGEELMDDAEALRSTGQLEPELIEAAIREHRQRHPYRP